MKRWVTNKKDFCRVCKTNHNDCVKTGNWAEDTICAICIDEQLIYEGRFDERITVPRGVGLEIIALSLIARKLNSMAMRISKDQP